MSKMNEQLGNPALLLMQGRNQQGGWTNSLDEGQRRIVNGVLVGGIVALAGGATFLILRSIARGAAEKRALNQTDDPDSPANYAQRLYNAFNPDTPFGWGTDEELVRDTIRSIPHRKFWDKVKSSYRKAYRGSNLMKDMQGELSRTMKQEIDLILEMLPANEKEAENRIQGQVSQKQLAAWAGRIRLASQHESSWIWPHGTDEEAIYSVLEELPRAEIICQLDRIYRRLYNKSVLAELMDELDQSELQKVYNIILSKPDAKNRTLTQIALSCT